MQSWMIGSAAGAFGVGWMAQLPGLLPPAVLLLCAVFLWRRRCGSTALFLVGLACGIVWGQLRGESLLQERLPFSLESRLLLVEGRILEPPQQRSYSSGGRRQRFPFAVQQMQCLDDPGGCPSFTGKVLLSYYGEVPLRAGQRWQFQVKLKRPWGLANPGSYNYQSWLAQHRFSATGYARAKNALRLDQGEPCLGYQCLRQEIISRLRERFENRRELGVLMALSSGDRSAIDHVQWRQFQQFGLNHLVVISGLHVGMVAGLGFLLGAQLGRLTVLWSAHLDRHRCSHLLAFALALVYSALAGFALPTQRALVMLGAAQLAALALRPVSPWRTLVLALWIIGLLDPLATLSAGFWLSFCAVLLIFVVIHWHPGLTGWRRVLLLQLLLSLVMGVLGSYWFGGLGLAAPLANLLAIPVLSFFLAPLCLAAGALALVAPAWSDGLWRLAGFAVDGFFRLALTLESSGFNSWYTHTTDRVPLVYAGAGILLLLAPRGWPLRYCGLLLLLPLCFRPLPQLQPADYEITVFDVGQGLALAVRSRDWVLLYDTGAGDPAGPNMASSVILPWLRRQGIERIDVLVISHGDRDHASGVGVLAAALPVSELWYGDAPFDTKLRQVPCRAGTRRQLGRAGVLQLHPAEISRANKSNNRSCVLLIDLEGYRLLLPGDIESSVERRLVSRWAGELSADLLLAPHHGSGSSSSAALLGRVAPATVIFSAGYHNRFDHPHPSVLGRYSQRGIQALETADSGAIRLLVRRGQLHEIRAWRQHRRFYWQ